jgi:hypothetical protein
MKCPQCQENNLIDARFCAGCGRPLTGDIPSYLLPEENDLVKQAKEFFEEIKGTFTAKDYKEILADRSSPATNMVISFIAWLLLRTVGIIPFLILVRILAFLMGYPGLLFLMVMTYAYSRHQKEIMEKVEELKGIDYKKTIREVISAIDGTREDGESPAPAAEEPEREEEQD